MPAQRSRAKKYKVLICGLGSIGARHARIFKDRLGCEVAALRVKGRGNSLGVPELRTWQEAAAFSPDVAVISNPTSEHVPAAIVCAKLGAHLMIEKPLSDSVKGLSELQRLCRARKRACYVAYPLRFHPVIKAARNFLKGKKVLHARVVCSSYLPDWRPGRDVRKVYSARKAQGGGVVLDLSHEFDYIEYCLGLIKAMAGVSGRVSGVTVDAEDFADVVVLTKRGTHVNVHLDYFSRKPERGFMFLFPDGYMEGDLQNNSLTISVRGKKRAFSYSLDRDDIFVAQARYVLGNLTNARMMNSLPEAEPLLRKILEFRHG
jgi:predicted dehydrogenase